MFNTDWLAYRLPKLHFMLKAEMNHPPTLRDVYLSHEGKGSDKWSSYLDAYEALLSERRDGIESLLEIGVQNGGSLEIWSKYFPDAKNIVGVDINPKVSWLEYGDPRIRAMVGDASTPDVAAFLKKTYPQGFDIIIDDGSHHSGDIVRSFAVLFDQVKVGGVYAAEDLHCSYWAGWEGGLHDPHSSMNFFKCLVDVVNFEHWGVDMPRAKVLEGFAKHYSIAFSEEQLAQIKRVEFVNSICFIYKCDPSETKMEPRMFTGGQQTVEEVSHLIEGAYAPPSQVDNPWSIEGASFDEKLQALDDFAQQLEYTRDREQQVLKQLHSAREDFAVRLGSSLEHSDSLRGEVALLKNQLDEYIRNHTALLNSLSWKMMAPVRVLASPLVGTTRFVGKITGLLGTYSISEAAKMSRDVIKEQGVGGLISAIQKSTNTDGKPGADGRPQHGSQSRDAEDYQQWLDRHDPLTPGVLEQLASEVRALPNRPLISVVMPVYNPPIEYLDAAIESLLKQVYTHWELCVADDASPDAAVRDYLRHAMARDERIRVVFREANGHISQASNSALELAQGEFVALMDNDDVLPPHALAHVALAINAHPDVEIIYSDEDKIDESGRRYEPHFKSDFNYELFLAQNMISHLGVYRRSTMQSVGGFRAGLEGAQDWDLALRVLDRTGADKVVHIPRVLYNWRVFEGSTARAVDEKPYVYAAQKRAVREHLERRGVQASVMSIPENKGLLRVKFAVVGQPKVSIVIPTKNKVELLQTCVSSVLEKSTYQNYEIIIVDNGSDEDSTLQYLQRIRSDRVRVIEAPIPFNYSKLNNLAVAQAQGDYVCLMNNDIEIISLDWMEEMLGFATQADVGCVGARLWYPDDTIQHAGVVLGVLGVGAHAFKGLTRKQAGYFGRAWLHQSYSAVTAACLMISRKKYDEVNGLDEIFAVAFNDVDFCIRVREAGYRNVWTPFAEMYHHESASRGYEDNPEKQRRFKGEVDNMLQRWDGILVTDPAYSPNLTLQNESFARR